MLSATPPYRSEGSGSGVKRFRFVGFFMLASTAASAEGEYPHGLPRSIQHFIERKLDCDHWMGEYPYDAERRAEIDRMVKTLRCDALSRDKTALERRYRSQPSALKHLDEW